MASWLDSIRGDEEILTTIRSCDPTKAPEYDGFNLKFLLQMWNIIGEEILAYVKAFFVTRQFQSSINTT